MRVLVPRAAILAVILLAGCAPLQIYYKPGVSVQRLSDATLDCEVRALRDAPVAQQVRQGPPVFIPPRKTCDSAGKCITQRGYFEPGQIYTVDVNRDLRARLERSCMARKGFTPTEIPACPAGLRAEGATTVLPRLTDASCAIRNRDGTFLIVDQG